MKTIGTTHGNITIFEDAEPPVAKGHVGVRTAFSAISPGTEISMSSRSLADRMNLGYSASGVIETLGEGVEGFKVGDRVAVYGAPYVGHREFLAVPQTLVAKVPDSVSLEEASMAGLGAIAIHGLRQANLQFGEICVVVGLGIYGQLIAQIAHNAGYVVCALNRSKPRADLLHTVSGIPCFDDEQEMLKHLQTISNNKGADAVFLCAGGGVSPLTNKSFEWLKDRGTSVIVGDIEPVYDRELMFGKELSIKISRAGGPGRYDRVYEMDAVDYPYGYVRWTEGRNVAEFIRLIEMGRIDVSRYADAPTPLDTYKEAYETLSQPKAEFLSHIFKY